MSNFFFFLLNGNGIQLRQRKKRKKTISVHVPCLNGETGSKSGRKLPLRFPCVTFAEDRMFAPGLKESILPNQVSFLTTCRLGVDQLAMTSHANVDRIPPC
jgi:hypothetical protein